MDLFDKIDEILAKGCQPNIVIAGISCSGKTTLANAIKAHYSSKEHKLSTTIFHQDSYYKNLSDITRSPRGYLMDSINAFYGNEFYKDVVHLLQFGMVATPVYDISRNMRSPEPLYKWNADILVYEGLHTITLLKKLPGFTTVFLDTDSDICLARRTMRDLSIRGVTKKRIEEYWKDCVMPMSMAYIYPQREEADIVLKNGDLTIVGK